MVRLDDFPGFSIGISQCRPASRGSVHLADPEKTAQPDIRPNYLSAPGDLDEMLEGVRILDTIAGSDAMQSVIDHRLLPEPDVVDEAALVADIRDRSGTVFHPVGSCAMGSDVRSSVVDPELRVHGVRGLRIADASIFPNLVSGNTNAACMMVGEKAADMIIRGGPTR